MGTIKVNKIESNITNQQVWAVNNGTSIKEVAKITLAKITFPIALNVTGLSRLNAGISGTFFRASTAPTNGTHLANKQYVDNTLAGLPKLVTILSSTTGNFSRSTPFQYTIPNQATMKYDMIVGNLFCNASDQNAGVLGFALQAALQPGGAVANTPENINLCASNFSGGQDGGHAFTVRMPFFFAIPEFTTQVLFSRYAGSQGDFSIQLTQLIRFPK